MTDFVTTLREAGYTQSDARRIVEQAAQDPEFFFNLERDAGKSAAPYWKYAGNPVGFITDILQENIWSTQNAICTSVLENERTIVPACHAGGKSHIASRLVSWWVNAWPIGTAQAITTATNFRTVRNQLWPHIRRTKQAHNLPGRMNLTEWWIAEELVAFGFSATDTDPEAVAGFHAPHLLIVVDEAGGISHAIGEALEGLLTSGHVRIVAIGNPSTDEEGTWFQKSSESASWHTIRLTAESTPNFTGEDAGRCKSCIDWKYREHPVAEHLLSKGWVEKAIADHGADSAFVVAKVKAQFPDIVANRTVPVGWMEDLRVTATNPYDPEENDGIRVKLGVDVASDGGDELAIARSEGFLARIVHTQRGMANANAVDVAGVILREILEAEEIAARLAAEAGLEKAEPVEVKVDAIGVGWGVCSTLETWGKELLHHAVIKAVQAGAKAKNPEKYINQRAEMHWNLREIVQPAGKDRPGSGWRFEIDELTAKQCCQSRYWTTSGGKIQIESKDDQRKRDAGSPDRAEAIMLLLYDPPVEAKKKARLIV